jgi:hypothetical protein
VGLDAVAFVEDGFDTAGFDTGGCAVGNSVGGFAVMDGSATGSHMEAGGMIVPDTAGFGLRGFASLPGSPGFR